MADSSVSHRDKILVVDDDLVLSKALQTRLRRLGFDVAGPASTGDQAVALALSEEPDLVLMDVNLLEGSMDGPQAAAKIREHSEVPFVFLTGHSDDSTLARVKPIEPDAFLIKPLDLRSLHVTIILALDRHRARQQRAQADAARKTTERLHAAVLDTSHDGVVSVNAEGRIAVFNKGAERIFGYSAATLIDQRIELIIPEPLLARPEGRASTLPAAASHRIGDTREVEGLRSSGERFPAEVSISSLELEGQTISTLCIRDISDRRLLERQLAHSQKMEAVGRLASSVVHDFNNLLTAVQVNVYLLRKEVSPDLGAYVDEISASVERGAAMTRQLMGFTRSHPPQKRSIAVNDIVKQTENLLRRLLRVGVRFSVELGPDAGWVFADRNLIEQVLMNLVVNARDAMPHGGQLSLRTGRLELGASEAGALELPAGAYASVTLTDTGTGIPAPIMDKIFEPFFTTKPAGAGTGLGLSTSRSIARRHAGDLTARAEPGGGSTFTLLLPETAPQEGQSPKLTSRVAPRGHEVILLVEDDVAVLVGISSVLRGHGYRVLSARSMRAALECVKDEATHVDLLITDLVFSDGAGLDLAAALAVRWPALSLVVIADQSQQPEAALGEMRERLTWIEKPISPDALLFVIRNCLDQGRAQASLGALGNA